MGIRDSFHIAYQTPAQLPVDIGMPVDALPRLGNAVDIENTPRGILLDNQFVMCVILVHCRMEGVILILGKGILFKIIVAVADIAGTEILSGNIERIDVVLLEIRVDLKIDPPFVRQEKIQLLLIACLLYTSRCV